MVTLYFKNRSDENEVRTIHKGELFKKLYKYYAYKCDSADVPRILVNWLPNVQEIELVKNENKRDFIVKVTVVSDYSFKVELEGNMFVLNALMHANPETINIDNCKISSFADVKEFLKVKQFSSEFDNVDDDYEDVE